MEQLPIPPRNNNPSINQKRWRSARLVIYCSRAFLHASKHNCRRDPQRLPPSSSSSVVDLNSAKNQSFGIDQATLELAANVDQLLSRSSSIDQATLTAIVKEKNAQLLQKHGHVDGIASALETNVNTGIRGDDNDFTRRREAFGTNTYKIPPPKGFLYFLWESFNDSALQILVVYAALSLGFGIREHGLKEGWYDAGSILVAVFIVIAVYSINNYRESRQFDKLSQVSNDIMIEVLRSGRCQN